MNYTTGGVSGGGHVTARSGDIAYTGGMWFLPVYQYTVDRTTGNTESSLNFFAVTAGVRYYLPFVPEALKGLFAGAELGYGIPLLQYSVRGSPKSVDLGTYVIVTGNLGYQYRMSDAISFEAAARFVFMPTSPVTLTIIPTVGASYHL